MSDGGTARVGQGIVVLGLSDQAAKWLADHGEERACLDRFASLMVEELAANDGKGNRPGWLQMDRKEAIAEINWHAAKLAVAAKEQEAVPTRAGRKYVAEYAADVANQALMALDCLGLLLANVQPRATQGDPDAG